ncbi:MAG: hypothetical protein LBT76_03110 [Tannerella sp.]|jgi:hypothetical protein|nr:hypothetical protein [Tannerella sp.]
MITVDIDKTTALENSDSNVAQVKIAKIPRDENGNPIGHTWEETREMMYDILSEHYGVDLRTL